MTTPRKPKTAAPADTAPVDVASPDVDEPAGVAPDVGPELVETLRAALEDAPAVPADVEIEWRQNRAEPVHVVHIVRKPGGIVAEYFTNPDGSTRRVVRRLADDELEEDA